MIMDHVGALNDSTLIVHLIAPNLQSREHFLLTELSLKPFCNFFLVVFFVSFVAADIPVNKT